MGCSVLQRAGFGQGRAQSAFDGVTDGSGPIWVAHCSATPALDDAHERHHLLHGTQLVVYKNGGRRLAVDQRLCVLLNSGVQLGKSQCGLAVV